MALSSRPRASVRGSSFLKCVSYLLAHLWLSETAGLYLAAGRCGYTKPHAEMTCGRSCQKSTEQQDCPQRQHCWFNLTRRCNQSETARCGKTWPSAASSCGNLCDGHLIESGEWHTCGKPCKIDHDCGHGERCFKRLPTWPCRSQRTFNRCTMDGVSINSTCTLLCFDMRDCPPKEECLPNVDMSPCTEKDNKSGSEDSAETSEPVDGRVQNGITWVIAGAVCVSVTIVLVSVGLCWLRVRFPTQPQIVHLQRSASELKNKVDALRNKRLSSLRAKAIGALAEHRRRRADVALARVAANVAGGPQNWALTVGQLEAFRDEHVPSLHAYCSTHRLDGGSYIHICLKSPCDCDHGDARFRPLSLGESAADFAPLHLNMHLVVSLLIKPKTTQHMGVYGYATWINRSSPLVAQTFVSHCWSDSFEGLVSALTTLRADTSVWICSFALPQNVNIGALLGSNLYRSPFARALLNAERLLLVVGDALEPLKRSWCCFEVYVAVSKKITMEIRAPITHAHAYRQIQAAVQDVDIRKCSASDADDHARIMSAIRGQEDAVNAAIQRKVEEIVKFLESYTP